MTYVLAWKTNAAIYISTDTVKTVEGHYTVPIPAESTFLERHIIDHDNNHFVHEGIIKIFNIDDHILYSFAGDVRLAYDIFETFKLCLHRCGTDVRSAFEASINDALAPERANEVLIVVGFINRGSPTLLTYQRGIISDSQNLVHYGSFTERPDLVAQVEGQILQGIEFVNTKHLSGDIDDEFHQTILSRVTGLLQSIGVHNPLIDIGVGGAFVSAAVTTNFGVIWPKCNSYVLYRSVKPFKSILTVTVRYVDNIVFIAVDGTDTVKAFVPGITMEQMNDAFKKYASINAEAIALNTNYIFLSTTSRHIFIVHKTPEHPNRWLKIEQVTKEKLRMYLTEGLVEKLFNENNPPALIDEVW